MNHSASHQKDKNRLSKVKDVLRSILLGATVFDMAQDALKMKWYIEQALMLASIGDLVGLPVISYYRLRLLPYWIRRIEIWRTAILKEKDFTDKILL